MLGINLYLFFIAGLSYNQLVYMRENNCPAYITFVVQLVRDAGPALGQRHRQWASAGPAFFHFCDFGVCI